MRFVFSSRLTRRTTSDCREKTPLGGGSERTTELRDNKKDRLKAEKILTVLAASCAVCAEGDDDCRTVRAAWSLSHATSTTHFARPPGNIHALRTALKQSKKTMVWKGMTMPAVTTNLHEKPVSLVIAPLCFCTAISPILEALKVRAALAR